jgi:hypothetical protein
MLISPARVDGDPYIFLNAQHHSFGCAPDFVHTDTTNTCSGYQSMDPRTVDSPRAMRLTLDRPPFYSRNTQPQSHMYTDQGNRTGFYNGYENINGGSIFYYTDLDLADPYGELPYSLPSYTVPFMQVDPMGAYRPIYEKMPIFQNNQVASGYTFDQDQMQFREDLMSLQSRKINESDYIMYHFFKDRFSMPEEHTH